MKKGDTVRWKYGRGHAKGKVVEIHQDTFEKTVQGAPIKRNGSPENPALLIEQEDGGQVVKLSSEVEKT